jgi:hypothetical protein
MASLISSVSGLRALPTVVVEQGVEMFRRLVVPVRKLLQRTLRKLFNILPQKRRFAVYRNFVECNPAPDERLVLKIADTKEELEACFTLLHDAYVGSGFMTPDPSGMRVTIYHALPTTTTLCAKVRWASGWHLVLDSRERARFPAADGFSI